LGRPRQGHLTVPEAVNPDHALIQRFLASPGPCRVDTNPVARDFDAHLIRWDEARRELTLRFRTGERHLQGNGVVQGGLVSAMLDFGLAFAVLAMVTPPRSAVTAALHVQFEAAVTGAELEVRAAVDRIGGRLAFASAELGRVGSTDVLARASSTLAVLG
jgi:acyl-coenzyme A thioesterase PaaI-like protein